MYKMSGKKEESRLKEQTIEYYNQYAEQFAERTAGADMSFCQNAFLKYLPEQQDFHGEGVSGVCD